MLFFPAETTAMVEKPNRKKKLKQSDSGLFSFTANSTVPQSNLTSYKDLPTSSGTKFIAFSSTPAPVMLRRSLRIKGNPACQNKR